MIISFISGQDFGPKMRPFVTRPLSSSRDCTSLHQGTVYWAALYLSDYCANSLVVVELIRIYLLICLLLLLWVLLFVFVFLFSFYPPCNTGRISYFSYHWNHPVFLACICISILYFPGTALIFCCFAMLLCKSITVQNTLCTLHCITLHWTVNSEECSCVGNLLHCTAQCSCVGNWKLENLGDLPDPLLPPPILILLIGEILSTNLYSFPICYIHVLW